MKYRLTEEQLNSLITESTIRILREASEKEGVGGAIGKGLGWLARKTANGVKDFGSNFKQQWQGQQNQNAGNGGQNTDQSNTNQNTGQNTNQNTNQNAGQNTNKNTNQNTDQSNTNQEQVIQQLQGQIKQLNQKITGLEQQVTNAAYGGMSDDDYADSGMNVGGQPQKKAPAQQGQRTNYFPNQTFSQQSYEQGKANGGDSRAQYESKIRKKAKLSEAYLSKIIKESAKHVLSEVDYSTMPKGDFYERDAWWKQQTDNDFPGHGIEKSSDWRQDYSRLDQEKQEKEKIAAKARKKEEAEQRKKENAIKRKEKAKAQREYNANRYKKTRLKYEDGRLEAILDKELGNVEFAVIDSEGYPEEVWGWDSVEVYNDGTWSPYEETFKGYGPIPSKLKPYFLKMLNKIGMRKGEN